MALKHKTVKLSIGWYEERISELQKKIDDLEANPQDRFIDEYV